MPAAPDPDEGPTLQTVAKLRPDVVLRLYEQRRLTRAMFKAAGEIHATWEALGRWSMPMMRLGKKFPVVQESIRPPLSSWERMSEDDEEIWRDHYIPWLRLASRSYPFAGLAISESRVVLDVVGDNRGVAQLERVYGIPRGKGLVTRALRCSLHRYADGAGWV